ncbi:unnamed protein product, partial [marine sediment metagenome]
RFEESLFKTHARGGSLDAGKITDLYRQASFDFHGEAVNFLPEQYKSWAITPLYYSLFRRFYNYPYAMAGLVMLVLHAEYREKGKAFVPLYRKLLAAGGSKNPADTLALAGLDLSSPAFWEKGFSELEKLLDRLKELLTDQGGIFPP